MLTTLAGHRSSDDHISHMTYDNYWEINVDLCPIGPISLLSL